MINHVANSESTEPAAILATFSEYKMIKTRKVLVLCLEVPLEQQAQVFAALGYPEPAREIWCAVARLKAPPKIHDRASDAYRRHLAHEYREDQIHAEAPQQAGRLAADAAFQEWAGCLGEDDAAEYIRRCCGVLSRRELRTNPAAYSRFRQLETEFLLAVGRLPTPA